LLSIQVVFLNQGSQVFGLIGLCIHLFAAEPRCDLFLS
jgi:hypothetical protein